MNKVETTYGRQKMKSMNTRTIVAIAIILAVLGAGYALARPGSGNSWSSMMGGNWNGNRMMGSYGNGITGGLGGMMGQYTGMMSNFRNGIWNGMMGNGGTAGYGGMMGGNWSGNGMMGYGNGNGYCSAGGGYTGSGYGANATP